jgi:hypothetical protein
VSPRPEAEVFWSWKDGALFVGLMLPCVLLSMAMTRGLFLLGLPHSNALYALTIHFVFYGFWLGALWLVLRFRYHRPFWLSLGWQVPWPKTWMTVMLGPGLAVVVALVALALGTPDRGSAIQALMTDAFSIALVAVFSTTLGPLCEELVFRGFFQPLFTRTFGMAAGIVLCAVPFALLHGPQYNWTWQIIVLLVGAGSMFGYTRLRLQSTAASTLVHAGYNLTFLAGYLIAQKGL